MNKLGPREISRSRKLSILLGNTFNSSTEYCSTCGCIIRLELEGKLHTGGKQYFSLSKF